jgi:Protein of unknown function (DUF2510)
MTEPVIRHESNKPAGWYPDPNGGYGQKYWDGRAWIVAHNPQAQYGGAPARLGPSVFATNAMALYSLVIGGFSILLDFLCGAGLLTGIIAGVVGFIALRKSRELGGVGRGMAIGGIVCSGIAVVMGVVGFIVIGGMMMGGQ